jgi:hypothetical protein
MAATKTVEMTVSVTTFSNEFLRCRTWGHRWDDFNPIDMGPPMFGWRESLRCSTCTTERHRIIGRNGQILSASYKYPEGYQMKKGFKAFPKGELRVEMFNRLRERLAAANAISGQH